MIKIQHIKAHLPSKNCKLIFMLRRKLRTPGAKTNDLKLTQDYVDMDVNCSITAGEFGSAKETIQLCAIAVTENDKICVGCVDVDLKESFQAVEASLKGVAGQDGYIVFSYTKEQKQPSKVQSSRSLEENYRPPQSKLSQKKSSNSRGFIKYKNSSSGSSYNENQQSFQNKSGSESPFRKNKFAQQLDPKSDEYHLLLDQLYHQILTEQLVNQKAWNKIQENQIFQLRYKQRIDALLSHSLPI